MLSCPVPIASGDCVLLGHGSGGKLSAELLERVFLPAFDNPALARREDQAVVAAPASRLAFTTDTFVVKPLFFPGGDIGSLAVHGTINDLAMGGADPLYLSAGFVLEEGFPLADLQVIVASMARAARQAGVAVVTGDTKVVEKGKGDGVFINTSGIGAVADGIDWGAHQVKPGDVILLSGSVGDHGMAILSRREGMEWETTIASDSAPLHTLMAAMRQAHPAIRCLRDPTRGGLATTLDEIAAQSRTGMLLEEAAIPIHPEVAAACELLGLDPLYVANEGKLVAIVAPEAEGAVLGAMRGHPLARRAARIGTVTSANAGLVLLRTAYGTTRIVDRLPGDQLPRIC
jgi:hydrogenase expression/formation protein HypE